MATFSDRQLYCLEEVPLEEAGADIKMYLNATLPCAEPKYIDNVVTSTAGLFIYASTIVKYIGKHTSHEQNRPLKKLFSVSMTPEISWNATCLLDDLYRQILLEAFGEFEGEVYLHCLHILFTLLCTSEHISTSIAAELLATKDMHSDSDSNSEISAHVDASVADDVLECLHAVLYVENNKVLWHHKSFPDFVFDQD